jgi:hypothetical protein
MKHVFSNDVVKLRMMAAQMRHNAELAPEGAYRTKFEIAADELERQAEEAERTGRRKVSGTARISR